MRDKKELYDHFQWVINRAKHYANFINTPIENVLNDWEEKRKYWWLNYYQDGNQPKFYSNSLKKIGIKGRNKHREKYYNDKRRKK